MFWLSKHEALLILNQDIVGAVSLNSINALCYALKLIQIKEHGIKFSYFVFNIVFFLV